MMSATLLALTIAFRFDVPQRIWQDCRDDDGICEPLLSNRAGVGRFRR